MVKELVPVTALNNDSLFSTVDDKSGAGGLLSGEIPGILKRAYCEPFALCPAAQHTEIRSLRDFATYRLKELD